MDDKLVVKYEDSEGVVWVGVRKPECVLDDKFRRSPKLNKLIKKITGPPLTTTTRRSPSPWPLNAYNIKLIKSARDLLNSRLKRGQGDSDSLHDALQWLQKLERDNLGLNKKQIEKIQSLKKMR